MMVRSGVTNPDATQRPASRSSLASTISTSLTPGASASTGCRPPSSAAGTGTISM